MSARLVASGVSIIRSFRHRPLLCTLCCIVWVSPHLNLLSSAAPLFFLQSSLRSSFEASESIQTFLCKPWKSFSKRKCFLMTSGMALVSFPSFQKTLFVYVSGHLELFRKLNLDRSRLSLGRTPYNGCLGSNSC